MLYPEALDRDGVLRGRVGDALGRTEYFLSGELDEVSAEGLISRLGELSRAQTGDVHLDVEDLQGLGPSGIRAIITAHHELEGEGRRLVLCNVQGAPLRTLQTTQTLHLLYLEYDQIG